LDDEELDKWKYPTARRKQIFSSTESNYQPEIIELCSGIIMSRCENNCVLMLGVEGLTVNKTSHFRIMAQSNHNRLYDKKPIRNTIENVGEYQFYWFTSNVSFKNPKNSWEYLVSVSVD